MRKFIWTTTSDFSFDVEADYVRFEPYHVVFYRYRTDGTSRVYRAIRNAQIVNLTEEE